MSRQRVVTGTDDRGRPRATWADPEPQAGGYGFMEPANGGPGAVERRQATPEELAAARARETSPVLLPGVLPGVITNGADLARARAAGIGAMQKLASRMEPPRQEPEEATVSEPAQDLSTDHREPDPYGTPYAALARAAAEADEVWPVKVAADLRWASAQDAVSEAIGALAAWLDSEPEPEPPDDGHAHYSMLIDVRDAVTQAAGPAAAYTDVEAIASELDAIGGGPAPRRNAREERTSGLTGRQAKAIGLMQSGRTRAEIARAMGTTYQTIDGLLEAAARKGLLPIELIPLLPARFAKYTGV